MFDTDGILTDTEVSSLDEPTVDLITGLLQEI